jgi:Protein of unknown function (DUF2795)
MLCTSIFQMSSSKRENREQIPKEDDIGEVQKAVSEQGGVEGQRKEVNVGDYAKTAALGQLLKDLDFPADKNNIIEFVQQSQQPSNITIENKQEILSLLQENLKEGNQYQNVSEVTRAAGIVQQ